MIRFSSNSSTNEIIQLLGGIENIQNVLNKTKLYKKTTPDCPARLFPVSNTHLRAQETVLDVV